MNVEDVRRIAHQEAKRVLLAYQNPRSPKATLASAKAAGKKLGINWDTFTPQTLLRGMKVEMEHAKGKTKVAKTSMDLAKIALAHLEESPRYYTDLAKMERAAKKNPSKKNTRKKSITPKKKATKHRSQGKLKSTLRELWTKALKVHPELTSVKLAIRFGLHDSPRHYARYYPATKTIAVDPAITDLPISKVRGLLAHELGHAVVHQTGLKLPKGYDAEERQADRAAEKACGLRIYYDSLGIQCAGPGARGTRPRPKGLK